MALQVLKRAIICLENTAACWENQELFANGADGDDVEGIRSWLSLPNTNEFTQSTPRRLDPPCLMRIVVETLGSLSDTLTGRKNFEAFVAAVKINDEKSRFYVIKLLIEKHQQAKSVHKKHVSIIKHLANLLAKLQELAPRTGHSQEYLSRIFGPLLFRAPHGKSTPEDDVHAAKLLWAIVKERNKMFKT